MEILETGFAEMDEMDKVQSARRLVYWSVGRGKVSGEACEQRETTNVPGR